MFSLYNQMLHAITEKRLFFTAVFGNNFKIQLIVQENTQNILLCDYTVPSPVPILLLEELPPKNLS